MSLTSLIQQPQSATPPQEQGASGSGDMSSLQALLQSKQAGNPGAGGAPGAPAPPPAPSAQETQAAIQHLVAFDAQWKQLLSDPEIGTRNMRSEIYDVMADMMGDGYVTLPQVMTELKTVPDNPLEQKQWLTKHYMNGQKAIDVILAQHAAAFPRNGTEPLPPPPGKNGSTAAGLAPNHTMMMGRLASRYQAATPKPPTGAKKPNVMSGIPMRMQ